MERLNYIDFQIRDPSMPTLTEGTKVTIMYELNRYTFKVLRCKPAKGESNDTCMYIHSRPVYMYTLTISVKLVEVYISYYIKYE